MINDIHNKPFIRAGKEIPGAEKALILLHGRGGTPEKMLALANRLDVDGYALFAPRATGNSWYPHSLLTIPSKNEPWLSAALRAVGRLVTNIERVGVPGSRIFFLGFSQGASLMLEFLARNPTRYGGAAAFTGGLIGDRIYPENYKGNFEHTPVFVGTGKLDPHLPVSRVEESVKILKDMGADTTQKIYENMRHVVNQDEIDQANTLIFRRSADNPPTIY